MRADAAVTSRAIGSAATALALAALVGAGCGSSSTGGGAVVGPTPDPGRVGVTFVAEVNGAPFACGGRVAGVGTSAATVEPSDLRFYVSEVRLVDAAGGEAPVALDQDGVWQLDDLALLDFEDATGRCSATGSPETNAIVRGSVVPGDYVGIRFTVGVPFERNHGDAATAPSPLDKTALFWNWNAGYRFLVFDGWVVESASELRLHVGSTRCDGDGRGHVTGCGNPNRIPVDLSGFDPRRDGVVADFGALFVDTDVERNAPQTPPGCMGSTNDADCAGPFAHLGLPFSGGSAGVQQLFRVGAGLAQPVPTPAPPTPTPIATTAPPDDYTWRLPAGFPKPAVPADNPMSEVKVELGRRLFYDTRLSLNQTQACASCHRQELAFSDARAVALGSTGELHPRNAQSLTNVAYNGTLTWMNPNLVRLEDQMLVPLFGEEPIELGLGGREDVLLQRLSDDPDYRALFGDAFPADADPISVGNLTKAIAAFERTLISGNSPYDRYVYQGDDAAMSESAKRGMAVFFNGLTECDHCHGGLNFSSALMHDGSLRDTAPFENNGLYNVGGTGAYPEPNTGLFAFTGLPRDMGRMKPPSLRNVELTAPYMHDGSIATLEDVVAHYERGGRLTASGPDAGDGAISPNKSQFVTGFPLSATARADLVEFLKSLTDREFIADPRFASPFAPAAQP
ncbi:MAG TPA: MbnH family di-heme enzyme [Candidatus Binatia bacterium]|nr:MbnH family di-heme enzyme [Candidatus Binatia bacterium]